MKLVFLAALFIFSAVFAENENNWDFVDFSNVITVEEKPGFFDSLVPELRPKQVHPRTRGRIIGGWEVEPHSHPYATFILSTSGGSSWRCGSSILSATAVITAAHCPIGSASTLIIAGAHNINLIEPTQQRRTVPSADYRIHPNYDSRTLQNDIAILLIRSNPISESPQIRYSRLPHNYANDLFAGELVSIVGWGRTCVTCPASPVLRGVQNIILTNQDCSRYYGTLADHQMCMQTTGQRGTCPGDSGGPYTLPSPGPSDQLQFVQIAVHSFGASPGAGGCEGERPSGSVRLTHFLDWVEVNMRL